MSPYVIRQQNIIEQMETRLKRLKSELFGGGCELAMILSLSAVVRRLYSGGLADRPRSPITETSYFSHERRAQALQSRFCLGVWVSNHP